MNNLITDNMDVVFYVVTVNGVEKSVRFSERMMAEMAITNLEPKDKIIAEVKSITSDGKQVLFG